MLVRLQVRDFAIVDRIEVEFDSGMSVLTGETGAGKSILVDALGLVLGDRGSAQLVRDGAKRAEFSAEFDVSDLPHVRHWLEDNSLDEDDECLLRRVIGADGRSRAFINGNAVAMQQMKSIGEQLVDIHGQHFHQSLGRRAVQRDLLDHYGKLIDIRRDTATAFRRWRELADKLQHLLDADADRASRLDLLTFQVQELRTLNVVASEFENLQSERQRLLNSGRLVDGISHAISSLIDDDDGNANSLVADSARAVDALSEYDDTLRPVANMLETAGIQIAEAADELRRYNDAIDMDPARRDLVEERIDAMQTIARKHRANPDELPALLANLDAELDDLLNAEERGNALRQDVAAAEASFRQLAKSLSERRATAGAKLSVAVSKAMHGLGMPGGEFSVALRPLDHQDAREHGVDFIEFEISANPGQPKMPMSKVASGGELSRMSLAIQVIASDGSSIPTMVFDEVDSGVGGGVAEMVGRRLAELGASRQVLCVTHLPQVASLATRHFRIAKVSDGKATRTSVQALGKDERIDELARMLGGVEITQKTLDHAAEMLAGAPSKRAG